MKVRATKQGTFNGFREPGEEFDYDGPLKIMRGGKEVDYFPSWMEPLEKVPSAKAESDDERDQIANEYEVVFGKKPHHNTKAETLRKEIDDHKAKMAD